ncbi:MAG: hypothetical protein ABSB32_06025 [Thermodesulfobacteriota bacterium]
MTQNIFDGTVSRSQVEPIRASFIKQFYQDKIRGKYKGREDEAKKIEAKINSAVASGRVTAG